MNRYIITYIFFFLSCDYSFAFQNHTPANEIIEKKIKVITNLGTARCYTVRPRDSFTYVISEYSITGINYCSDTDETWSFDVNGRISTVINGLDYCLTAPDSVINEKVDYDLVRVFRCDMSNNYQKWYVNDMHFKSYLGNFKIKNYNEQLYISIKNDDKHDHRISPNLNEWIDNYSIPRTYNFSLSMNYKDANNNKYYSNYRSDSYLAFRTTNDDSYRVLYSPYTKLLSFQHKSGTNESIAFCLKSNNKEKEKIWQYSELSNNYKCPSVTSSFIPKELQWDMVPIKKQNNNEAMVKFFDYLGNPLKIWVGGGSNGIAFTVPNDALPSYEYIATTSKSEFFVNAAVSDWVEFLSANEQVRSQHCPAPANNYTAISPRVLPDSFHLTDDWYLRLLTIAASPTQGVHIGLGVCGACYLETLEILREFYESLNGSVPNSHYFDPTEQITAVDQLSYSYPALYASLETIWQEALSDSIALTDQHRAGQITEEQYLTSFHTRFEQLHVSTQNNFLPDFYQVSPSTFRFTGYTDDMTQQINSILPNDTASVGTTAIVVTQFYLSNNQPDSHSVPLVRFSDGWSVLEVAVPNATLSRVDRYNRARFPTASEAIFNYFQTRSPYFINGHNNVNFGNISNIMLINQVNIRPITIVSNPLVSFGNCTGEGEDGRRGTGKLTPETQEKNSIQNLCVTESGEISRCYGARNLNETNSPSVVSECQHLYNSNGKEWLWNGSFGHYYSSKNTCENANMCNDNGGLCFQWKKREKGRCEHLNYYNNKWEWVIFPRYSTSSSCKAENKCSEGGACYQWVEN